MTEAEFVALAQAELDLIESAVESAADEAGVDIDVEVQPGGILKLEFENASQIIINRHVAAQEIWVAARSGGFHFRPEAGQWIGTRDGRELWDALRAVIAEQAGTAISLQH
jgi:CyaY protein